MSTRNSLNYEKGPLIPKTSSSSESLDNVVLVIHGGAGTMSREGSTPEQRKAFRLALSDSLKAGYAVLKEGGEAMDAAVAAVSVMEDNPLFNAGKGAVFNSAGKLEASIMLSKPPISYPTIPSSRRGAGLTLLTRVRNPSKLARAAYLHPDLVPHAFLSGSTAEEIGKSLGEELVDPSYFFTEHRWREHRRGLGLNEEPLPARELIDYSAEPSLTPEEHDKCTSNSPDPLDPFPTGTVGAVALDARGCIAAVTSTGGRTNKLPGRIGDTPLMGAGFWAEEWDQNPGFCLTWAHKIWNKLHPLRAQKGGRNRGGKVAVGVSGTGDGDYFIRQSTASTVARRMQYAGESVERASEKVVEDLFKGGGIGGVIALDNKGNVALPLNCPGMYRGVVKADGIPKVAIFREDALEEVVVDSAKLRNDSLYINLRLGCLTFEENIHLN